MARDTDRKIVSEALRLSGRWNARWSAGDGKGQLILTDAKHNELDITYSAAGQITHVSHWEVVEKTLGIAHRRQRVLEIIEGKGE